MRLRVLPLPHSGDPADPSTPFVLVFDEVTGEQRAEIDRPAVADALRVATGARGVIAFSGTVALPEA